MVVQESSFCLKGQHSKCDWNCGNCPCECFCHGKQLTKGDKS